MPRKYTKKPVTIEAEQYDGSTSCAYEILSWITGNGGQGRLIDGYSVQGPDTIGIQTLEGEMTASPQDWVIRGIKGEFYPCKPDVFEATYEVAGEPYHE